MINFIAQNGRVVAETAFTIDVTDLFRFYIQVFYSSVTFCIMTEYKCTFFALYPTAEKPGSPGLRQMAPLDTFLAHS